MRPTLATEPWSAGTAWKGCGGHSPQLDNGVTLPVLVTTGLSFAQQKSLEVRQRHAFTPIAGGLGIPKNPLTCLMDLT